MLAVQLRVNIEYFHMLCCSYSLNIRVDGVSNINKLFYYIVSVSFSK
jgi:hypothetical protein